MSRILRFFFTSVDTFDQNGNLVARNQCVTFAVGAGKFGGPRTGTKAVPCQPKPSRNPDATLSQKTSVDQAALYRLSGKNSTFCDIYYRDCQFNFVDVFFFCR